MILSRSRQMVSAALCIALGVLLPMLFHSVPMGGSIFLPMHLPVLLCGLICGWQYGLIAGVLTPLISSIATGMPPAAYLPSMVAELAVYGLVAGILIKLVRTKSWRVNVYISLVGAMLLGRIVYGAVQSLIFRAGDYSLQLWLTGAFVTALPGIIIQLILIPAIIEVLYRSRVLEGLTAN